MTEEAYDPKQKQRRDGKTGLPIVDESKAYSNSWRTSLGTAFMMFLIPAVGIIIAFSIYAIGDKKTYDSRIKIAKENRLDHLMLATVIF